MGCQKYSLRVGPYPYQTTCLRLCHAWFEKLKSVLCNRPCSLQNTLLSLFRAAVFESFPRDKHAKLHCRKLFVALPMRIRACVTSLRSEPTKLCALTVSENLHSRQRSTEMQREIHLRGGKTLRNSVFQGDEEHCHKEPQQLQSYDAHALGKPSRRPTSR